MNNPLNYIDPFGLVECREKQRSDEGTEVDCEDTVDATAEDPREVDLAFLLAFDQFKSDFAAFKENSLSTQVGHSDFNYSGMSFQQHMELGGLMGEGGDCTDPNCLMLSQVVYSYQNDPLLKTIMGASELELAILSGNIVAETGPAANAAQRTGRFFFGRGGLLNSNRYLRIGESAHKGQRYFSIRGQAIDRITGPRASTSTYGDYASGHFQRRKRFSTEVHGPGDRGARQAWLERG